MKKILVITMVMMISINSFAGNFLKENKKTIIATVIGTGTGLILDNNVKGTKGYAAPVLGIAGLLVGKNMDKKDIQKEKAKKQEVKTLKQLIEDQEKIRLMKLRAENAPVRYKE